MDNSRHKYKKIDMFGGGIYDFFGRGKFPLWMPRINTERELNVNLDHDVHLDHA